MPVYCSTFLLTRLHLISTQSAAAAVVVVAVTDLVPADDCCLSILKNESHQHTRRAHVTRFAHAINGTSSTNGTELSFSPSIKSLARSLAQAIIYLFSNVGGSSREGMVTPFILIFYVFHH